MGLLGEESECIFEALFACLLGAGEWGLKLFEPEEARGIFFRLQELVSSTLQTEFRLSVFEVAESYFWPHPKR